jgi:hypothetical protein
MTKQERKEYNKLYYRKYKITHKKELLEYSKEYKLNHKQEKQIYMKEYRQKNREQINKYNRIYRKDIQKRLIKNLRKRIWDALKYNYKSITTMKLVGCSIEHLKSHLEKQFTSGMSWSNYGKWHVDHIRPCVSFNMKQKSEQLKCFNYKNLQPLWALDNVIKSDKY